MTAPFLGWYGDDFTGATEAEGTANARSHGSQCRQSI